MVTEALASPVLDRLLVWVTALIAVSVPPYSTSWRFGPAGTMWVLVTADPLEPAPSGWTTVGSSGIGSVEKAPLGQPLRPWQWSAAVWVAFQVASESKACTPL